MSSRMAIITFFDGGGGSIDNTLPGGPVYPSHGLPGLPPGAVQLPVFPFDPTVPDQGLPPTPDQGLPGVPPTPGQGLPGWQPRPSHPIAIVPGAHFIVKWLACTGLILVPDHTLPPTPEPK
jgi:hypothetical protein